MLPSPAKPFHEMMYGEEVKPIIGNTTKALAVSQEVKRFKKRSELFGFEGKEGESKTSSAAVKNNPSELKDICIKAIAVNFAERPSTKGVPDSQLPKIYAHLPLGLDVATAAAFVHDENYWKRSCLEGKGWYNSNIARHGLTWKQMFFERSLQDELELFDPSVHDFNSLLERIKASGDYVFGLEIKQLLSHLDLQCLFDNLPNLSRLDLTYGVRHIGMKYERALFGMKISDAQSLARCIKSTNILTTLSLPCNLIDDELLRMLASGLISNKTVTSLDLSHNKITNHGARLLSKLLGPMSVITTMNLADNQIHAEGGKNFGRALQNNDSLHALDLRLNRLTDEGGSLIFEGLRNNTSLETLNLSSNSLGPESARVLCSVLKTSSSALVTLDLSCNELNENDCKSLEKKQ